MESILQLHQLVKTVDEMTEQELLEHLRQVRHRREVQRPAARKIVERAESKVSRKKMSAAEKLLSSLSPEEIAKLLENNEEPTNE